MSESQTGKPNRDAASRLLREARAGSDDARGQLLNLYSQFLTNLAAANLDPKLGAKTRLSDVVQETFVRAHKDFHAFVVGSVREWEQWLTVLALNTVTDLRRRYRRKKRDIDREQSIEELESKAFLQSLSTLRQDSPERGVAAEDQAERILRVVPQLKPSHQAVILWHFQQGLDAKQIAAKVGRTEDAVRMLIDRAVKALRKKVGKCDAS
jgi:RNA polymerase sigma-70 factor (ECF subfamily)